MGSTRTIEDENDIPTEWNLYEFFRAPGIYYFMDKNSDQIHYYGSDSLMAPHTYGYRLGAKEEVNLYEKLNRGVK